MAQLVLGQQTTLPVDVFRAERFEEGELFVEPSVV